MLTTAVYLVANWRTGTMRYANAGHPKPIHVRRTERRADLLANTSGRSQPALGLFEDASYQSSEIRMLPSDLIMLFTDGLYEVQAADDMIYTQELLASSVERRVHLPASELFDELISEIKGFSGGDFTDDVCLVAMEYAKADSPS
jgi:sigma-B regulation protein RsbU (phosphoserine phosphatase)